MRVRVRVGVGELCFPELPNVGCRSLHLLPSVAGGGLSDDDWIRHSSFMVVFKNRITSRGTEREARRSWQEYQTEAAVSCPRMLYPLLLDYSPQEQ